MRNRHGLKRTLVPQSETIFVISDNGDEVEFVIDTFVIDTKGTVTQLIVHGGGNDQKAVHKGMQR